MAQSWPRLKKPWDDGLEQCMEHRLHTRKEYTDLVGKEVLLAAPDCLFVRADS